MRTDSSDPGRSHRNEGEISLMWGDFLHVNSFTQAVPPRQDYYHIFITITIIIII